MFRLLGAARTRDQRILSAAWRAKGAASHRTGCELHLLSDRVLARNPDVTVGVASAHEFPGVVVHRSADLLPSDITSVRGIPVTTVTRTLVDVGLRVGELHLEQMVHRALHRRLTTVEALLDTYDRVSRRGRHGAGPIGVVLRRLDPTTAPAESELEVLLIKILRDHGVDPPVRQHPVEIAGQRFRLDLAYPDERLFLEGDGFGVHGARASFEADRWRQNLLVEHGWLPLRFTWRQLRSRPSEAAGQVRRTLESLRG